MPIAAAMLGLELHQRRSARQTPQALPKQPARQVSAYNLIRIPSEITKPHSRAAGDFQHPSASTEVPLRSDSAYRPSTTLRGYPIAGFFFFCLGL